MEVLESAPSKKAVQNLFLQCFQNRNNPITKKEKEDVVELLKIKDEQAEQLLKSIREVISESLYYSMTEEDIAEYLGNIKTKLKDVIKTIIKYYLPQWRESAIKTQVSLPLLQNIDWRIDIKSASDQLARMSVPTVIVQLQVEEAPTTVGKELGTRNINFELTKDALEVMLEGLEQIKKQLDSI